MPILKAVNSKASFHRAADYVVRKAALLDSINCRAEYAEAEMDVTRSYYGKTGGRTYAHYVLSFPPNSGLSPKECAEITKEVVKANPYLHGHEVLIAVHDVDNIHSHVIANSVRKTDGAKYHCTKPQYRAWIKTQQEICRKYGFEPVEKKMKDRGEFICNDRTKYETVRRMGREADLVVVYQAIDIARKVAEDWNSFEKQLKEKDILIERSSTRKHIVFAFHGHRFRDSNLAKSFSDTIDKEELEHEFFDNKRRNDEKRRLEYEHRIDREIADRERDIGRIVEGCLSSECSRKERAHGRERTRE